MRYAEDIYLDIAKLISDAIDDDCRNASVYIEFYGDSAHFSGRYESEKLALESFEVHHSVLDLLIELDAIINPDNSKSWNRAKFYLEPDGEFNMEFAWDQELADEIAEGNRE